MVMCMNHHEVQIKCKRAPVPPWHPLLLSSLLGISREELATESLYILQILSRIKTNNHKRQRESLNSLPWVDSQGSKTG